MEANTLNRYQMALSTQNYLDTHNGTWSAIPIINTFKASLDELIQGMKEQLKRVGESTKGYTEDKNVLKEQISNKVAVLSGALSAYAMVSDDHDLHQNAYLTKSDVLKLRDTELPERLSHLADLLTEHLTALVDYGVTEAQVTDLTSSVDDYRETVGLPRLKMTATNLAKRSINELMDDISGLFTEKMDKVMLQFQWSNPSFYAGYKSARTIVG
ncbi:hypothetical protein BFP72_10505 [Reichenbachiella sp. 5M10]|uniref:hypothetical protein n=1 Tax=Reichenbachiella sp. 5M10 TaxID=1889772 RepID=UPI000C15FA72|nr:hypothetical protein [Reichenbachiella sp. 5M10]PIB35794.1 hypothetical protein BFP72_10505 [Reichenbachiella sp. 5M10]